MLTRDYLVYGLNALSRANETNYFADGHRGAAILSAYYLCAENQVEPGVSDLLASLIGDHWLTTPLCAPFPEEPVVEVEGLVDTLAGNVGVLRQAGHNVIFGSLALKALRDVPEAATPSRLTGLCRLIECFQETLDLPLDAEDASPPVSDPEQLADFALHEYLDCTQRFLRRGQGWSGHLLTFTQALVDLQTVGYGELVLAAAHAYRQYIKRIRLGPKETDGQYAEHAPSPVLPLQRAYWERRREAGPGLGHGIKYPYGFYGLLSRATDAELRQQALAEAFRVL